MIQTPTRISQTIPPLENGDRLFCDEFERRYEAMPDGCKAELIEGIVYMSAALRFKSHGRPHGRMMTWLGTYEAETTGVEIADNVSVRLDDETSSESPTTGNPIDRLPISSNVRRLIQTTA